MEFGDSEPARARTARGLTETAFLNSLRVMPTPAMSIILPVYNGVRFLEECIDSVLAQTMTNFELIIIDDKSADASAAMVRRYEDPRIRFVAQAENRGLFPTLNAGIGLARGAQIRFLGQDDRLKPHCLAAEDQFWREHHGLGLSYCNRDTIDANGQTVHDAPEDLTPAVMDADTVARISLHYGCMPGNISTVVCAREAFEAVGLFNEEMIVSGDFEMWVRIAQRYRTGFIRDSLLDLRNHESQLSSAGLSEVLRMEEDEPVLDMLWSMVGPDPDGGLRRFVRWNRYRQYAHTMVRYAARGQWSRVARVHALLQRIDRVPALLGIWLATANGRLFMPRRLY